ncbi:DUF3037 domain-containing protein [Algivirga pacifica]|uniref:DUF3037 domain-containing protein n=1 Tax=Algivirga pacifica TaxID=1162670 RepID=A0ABP9D5Q2_9BACT
MQGKELYEYAVIRFVPSVEREEFVNIGVILYCKFKRYIGIRYHIDEQRLNAFSKHTDCQLLKDYLEGWEKVCHGRKDGGVIAQLDMPNRFRWLAATRSTIIQSSPTHTGFCEDPEAEVDKLLEEYVLS